MCTYFVSYLGTYTFCTYVQNVAWACSIRIIHRLWRQSWFSNVIVNHFQMVPVDDFCLSYPYLYYRLYILYRYTVYYIISRNRAIIVTISGGAHGNRNTRRHARRPFSNVFYTRLKSLTLSSLCYIIIIIVIICVSIRNWLTTAR